MSIPFTSFLQKAIIRERVLSVIGKERNIMQGTIFRFSFLKLKCCGSLNYTDWDNSKWQQKNTAFRVPLTCCKEGGNSTSCNAINGFDPSKIHDKVITLVGSESYVWWYDDYLR